jgi:formate dehydrogenase subunit gamma
VHWVHAGAFCVLLGSGLCLYLPSLAEAVGRRPLVKAIHLWTALTWVVALVVVLAVGDRRSLRRFVREVEYLDADDRAWLRGRGGPQGRPSLEPPNFTGGPSERNAVMQTGGSRLNAGQKLNTVATAAFAILFAFSGFFLWLGERDTRFRLAHALLVHDYLMYVSLLLFLGHLWFALLLPSSRHSLNGITRGWVRRDWASRRHPRWVEGLDADAE